MQTEVTMFVCSKDLYGHFRSSDIKWPLNHLLNLTVIPSVL